MISASLTEVIVIPMLFHLVVILICWLYYQLRKSAPELVRTHHRIYRCQVCGHVYVDSRHVPLARCGKCGCLNEAIKT